MSLIFGLEIDSSIQLPFFHRNRSMSPNLLDYLIIFLLSIFRLSPLQDSVIRTENGNLAKGTDLQGDHRFWC